MSIINTVRILYRQHKTRQELRYLPASLMDDIGKTSEEINDELNKNSLKHYFEGHIDKLAIKKVKRS